MHPQSLLTLPQGRQALAIGAHNMAQNKGKRNLFSQNWSDNNARKKGYKIPTVFLICCIREKMSKTGTADLMNCASKIYF